MPSWDLPSSVRTAGPQPGTFPAQCAPLDLNLGPSQLSAHRWTSMARENAWPERMPDRMSDRMPEDMPDKMPDRMPDGMPEDMPECLPDRMPENLPVTKRIDVMVGITRSKVIDVLRSFSEFHFGTIALHGLFSVFMLFDFVTQRPPCGHSRCAGEAPKSSILGHGAFGDVERRVDHQGNQFAFKKISGAVVQHRGMEHAVQAEINSLQVCQGSRFVVDFFHHFVAAGDTILVFELLDDLVEAYVHRKLFGNLAYVRLHLACVAMGLSHIHEKNVLHRDIKPANLLLKKTSGQCKIADFGHAKITFNGRSSSQVGTPNYMAPEVVKGRAHGKEVDYWSLGCVLFELCTGELLFTGSPSEAFSAIMAEIPTSTLHKAQALSVSLRAGLGPNCLQTNTMIPSRGLLSTNMVLPCSVTLILVVIVGFHCWGGGLHEEGGIPHDHCACVGEWFPAGYAEAQWAPVGLCSSVLFHAFPHNNPHGLLAGLRACHVRRPSI